MTLSQTTQILQKYIQENSNPNKISESEISKKYQELIDCITDHNHLYYIDSAPIISDLEYDQLFDYIKKIEQFFPYMISWNSPTQKLINQIQEGFEKYDRKNGEEILSLENSYNSDDIILRKERVEKIIEKQWLSKDILEYTIEPKFDWVSIELRYEDWKFLRAVTRWDWKTWEVVTENVRYINKSFIPRKLEWIGQQKGLISFRWEIIVPKSKLIEINKIRKSNWENIYANTRNLASGSLKQLKASITWERWLQCYVYEKWITSGMSNSWDSETLNKILETPIKNFWFKTISLKDFKQIEEVITYCTDNKRKNNIETKYSDIEFDWLVVKIKDKYVWENRLRNIIWSTAHHPRRAIAYKFPAEQVSTQIESIQFQVGRTGIITPVANLSPVNLSWATISRVSLHNFDFIKDKDIHHKDFVRLQRSGEVIPYVTWVIKERRLENAVPVVAPNICPSCNTFLTPIDMHYYCKNFKCPAQIKEKIIRFVSKNCMDIEWIGESIVEVLVDNKIIANISDLYKLLEFETERVVHRFPWFADKKVVEIQKQLQESKNKEFRRLLNWLWIPWIWKKTAKDISNELSLKHECTNLEWISKYLTDSEFLIWIYGIGDKIIEAIINYRKVNLELLKKLEKIWLNFSTKPINNSQFTNNKSFCITWSFDFPRPRIIEKMEKNWYTFDPSPNKNTNYMLIWSKPWSKLSKAEELWIDILKWRDNIAKQFSFLLEIEIDKTKNSWPEQLWLF